MQGNTMTNPEAGKKMAHKHLFLDDAIVERMDGLTRTMHQPEKRGPVLKPDIPSDGEMLWGTTPLWIPGKASTRCSTTATAGRPATVRRWRCRPTASTGRNPRWTAFDVPPLPSFDTSSLCYDPDRGRWIATLKMNGKYGRAVGISVSEDFEHWSERRFFFGTDDEDQRLGRETIRRRLADPGLAKPFFVEPDPALGWQRQSTRCGGRYRYRAPPASPPGEAVCHCMGMTPMYDRKPRMNTNAHE